MEIDKKNLLELEILKHVEETPILNNRMAADKLGCSVKLAHEILSKMVDKGLFHVKKYHARRWDYFLTPKGISEKARLTYEFLDFSMHFYREARKRSSQLCRDLAEQGIKKVAFIGAGDLAEIVYLGVKEWGLELIDVYANTSKKEFMGLEIKSYKDLIRLQTTDYERHTINQLKVNDNQYSFIINNLQLTTNYIVCVYDKNKPTDKNSKYLPEDLAGLQSTNNHGFKTNLYWIF